MRTRGEQRAITFELFFIGVGRAEDIQGLHKHAKVDFAGMLCHRIVGCVWCCHFMSQGSDLEAKRCLRAKTAEGHRAEGKGTRSGRFKTVEYPICKRIPCELRQKPKFLPDTCKHTLIAHEVKRHLDKNVWGANTGSSIEAPCKASPSNANQPALRSYGVYGGQNEAFRRPARDFSCLKCWCTHSRRKNRGQGKTLDLDIVQLPSLSRRLKRFHRRCSCFLSTER